MAINYNEKIEKINNDRLLMLNAVKDNITNNGQTLLTNLDVVIDTLDKDEINTRKYKSIIRVKQLILELTEQIINTNNLEDVTKLRKRVNYYINIIKKELNERNVSQEHVNIMYKNVDYLRTDMTKYIRYLRRVNNTAKIEDLYKNFDSLSSDEVVALKKLLSNEERYNKRFKSIINDYTQKEKRPVKKAATETVKNAEKTTGKVINNHAKEQPIIGMGYTDKEFLRTRVAHYLNLYKFSKIKQYDGSLGNRISIVLNNAKNIFKNKKIMTMAERDYNVYYHGDDLAYFMAYFNKRNSIKFGLQLIFSYSKLSQREIECLLDHNKCFDWINEFCISKEIDVDTLNKPSVKRKIRFGKRKQSAY